MTVEPPPDSPSGGSCALRFWMMYQLTKKLALKVIFQQRWLFGTTCHSGITMVTFSHVIPPQMPQGTHNVLGRIPASLAMSKKKGSKYQRHGVVARINDDNKKDNSTSVVALLSAFRRSKHIRGPTTTACAFHMPLQLIQWH